MALVFFQKSPFLVSQTTDLLGLDKLDILIDLCPQLGHVEVGRWVLHTSCYGKIILYSPDLLSLKFPIIHKLIPSWLVGFFGRNFFLGTFFLPDNY